MERDQSTLQPSELIGKSATGAEQVPGLMRLFVAGRPMAMALPLRGEEFELGRSDAALGELQDRRMSRRHARVRFDGRHFWVTDLGSQNGTFADGEPVSTGAPREARRIIRMGDSLFVPCLDVNPLARRGVQTMDGFVRGPALQELLAEVARAAQFGTSLHIHGESGTGKEGISQAFHKSGPRSAGPFVAVNCAAIPEGVAERLLFGTKRGAYSGADAEAQGYLQAADGGTLFLDEVVELDLAVQAKLLRALETKEVLPLGASRPKAVDIQICSATHRELRALVANGLLREDLYFRIGRPEVSLPPLRERPEEIPLLLHAETQRVAPNLELHVSLMETCLLRPWPGNIRELLVEVRSAIQSALMQGAQRVEARHLSPSAGTAFGPSMLSKPFSEERPPPHETSSRAKPLDADMRARIEETLRQQGGNVAATARVLGMHRTQLRRLMDRYAITAPAGEDRAEDEG